MHVKIGSLFAMLALALGCPGCDDDLVDSPNAETGLGSMPDAPPTPHPGVQHEQQGEMWRSRIDASDKTQWVFLDLDDRAYPNVDENKVGSWDLAFQRVKIHVNGGITGSGGVTGLFIEGADAFANTAAAPVGDYVTDVEANADPAEDIFGEDGRVFGFWYDYASQGHVVTPKARTYVVKSTEHRYFKLKITDYYNAARTSAHYTIEWQEIAPPAI